MLPLIFLLLPVTLTTSRHVQNKNYNLGFEAVDQQITNLSILETFNRNNEFKIKICIQNGHVNTLEDYKVNEIAGKGCFIVERELSLLLRELDIKTFQNNWYRLQDNNVQSLNFEGNGITQITRQLLNDLPHELRHVSLRWNKIERLEEGIIENKNLIHLLDLSYNRISEIEDGALQKMNVTELYLNNNRLKNIQFLYSLPSTMRALSLNHNEIIEIAVGNFSNSTNLGHLDLCCNNIVTANDQQLVGASSLLFLDLSNNSLRMIERGFFHNLKNLMNLELQRNDISSLEEGVFSDLKNIVNMQLESNQLREIKSGVFSELPDTLESLFLSNNQINRLTNGSFVNVPSNRLHLDGNKISIIERGSFDLPNLWHLNLKGNLLKEMDGDSFEGLRNLRRLSLASNEITTIKKRAGKNLNHLYNLDLSNNPITILKAGALFGLPKIEKLYVNLSGCPVDIIEDGVLDDV